VKALSSEACRDTSGLASWTGLLALLMGLEKLNAGRGSWEPPMEYSDEIEGDRATEWFVQGAKGECVLEMLDVGDKFLACNES
jgi:hypothetical protein